ncbi:uncharacterized protein EMH_0086020 [Eimeria mitis]|uniref:Uncharacterized protein n=1 Tax=Eimeria mitis TaxID=44415 RepID=U6KCD6_9EIME|nr:uncharacterized protein EMH_0086020 [Eimeria mitis]CDJ33867.1 hypothetical protein EMH_0086020 [Eimeria mitis]
MHAGGGISPPPASLPAMTTGQTTGHHSAAPATWGQLQQHSSAQYPTRAQQVQPVLLPPMGASPYAMDAAGNRIVLGQPQQLQQQQLQQQQLVLQQQQQLPARGASARFNSFKSSAAKRIDFHLKRGMGSFVLLWTSSAVLLFLFLQELVFNFTSFNGRCIGPVLYPPWTEPEATREPRLVSFGYGACEWNLGLRDGISAAEAAALGAPEAAAAAAAAGAAGGAAGGAAAAAAAARTTRILSTLGALDTNLIRNYGVGFLEMSVDVVYQRHVREPPQRCLRPLHHHCRLLGGSIRPFGGFSTFCNRPGLSTDPAASVAARELGLSALSLVCAGHRHYCYCDGTAQQHGGFLYSR